MTVACGPVLREQPVVLVTGATGGIGAATAMAYAARGARLVLLARSPGALETLRGSVTAAGAADALVTVADVADGAAVDSAFRAAAARFGRVDVVVHSAAVVAYGRLDEVPADVWDRVVAVNLTGTANVARSTLARFAVQAAAGTPGGSLVVVGSLLGQATVPLMGSYVTSKWGVRGLTRVLQQEARSLPGVHVAIVNPGSIRTPIYDLAANYAGRIGRPPPPVFSPERVARTVLRVVDRQERAAGVSFTNPVIRLGFTLVPRVYDVLVTPMMRVAGLRREGIEPHEGNVFTPSEDVEQVEPDKRVAAPARR